VSLDLSGERIYVTGVAETQLGEVHDQTELSMVALAAREALTEAGLRLRDVDGVLVNYMGEEGSVQVGEYLGIQPRWADSSDLGGAAFEAFLHHAAVAIASGRCSVALIAFASRQRSRRQRGLIHPDDPLSLAAQFQTPYGLPMPIGHYALIAARHMYQYGTTSEQLAEVAVAARRWAQLNPKAWSRDPLTVEDVIASRTISDPLHKLDCCLITDGGGAVVVTDQAHARDARKRPIRIIGAGESHTHWHIAQMPDLTVTAGAVSAREAFGMAGVTPADIDVFQPYDAFTITPILAVEDLGFCAKGEGGDFVSGGRLAPGGALPSMTSGGGLSYNHPGALGVLLIVEQVRQLRGEAGERQVSGARIGAVHGIGGFLSVGSTVVMARD
jgi:acetyl-CoA acetyltransferase